MFHVNSVESFLYCPLLCLNFLEPFVQELLFLELSSGGACDKTFRNKRNIICSSYQTPQFPELLQETLYEIFHGSF